MFLDADDGWEVESRMRSQSQLRNDEIIMMFLDV